MQQIKFNCDQDKMEANKINVALAPAPKAKSSKDEIITFFWNVIRKKNGAKFPFVALKKMMKSFSIHELYVLKSEVQDRINRDQNYGAHFWNIVKSRLNEKPKEGVGNE